MNTKYDIIFKGEVVSRINSHLIETQNREEYLEEIIKLHVEKLELYETIKQAPASDLKDLSIHLTHLEYRLQDAWGFTRSEKYHRFWQTPRCICPKMDNEDRYPSGYSIVAMDCPLHGGYIST